MATYVNDLRLKEITTGDESGTWGTSTNTNLELIGEALGYGTEAVADASTHTITMADGATDGFRCTFLRLTGGGQACTVTLAPNTLSHTWIIRNTTSYALTFTQGSGANVIIAAGLAKMVTTDGLGSGAVVYECLEALELGGTVTVGIDDTGYDVKFFGATSGAYMLWDESADDLKLVGAAGLTVAGTALVTGVLTTTATQVATGGITSGSNIISDADSTDSLGSTGVRWLKGWFDTLTAGTLTIGSGSVTDSSGAISFGNENLTTTGIVTAAGTSVFTNLDISGDVDVDGTLNVDAIDIDGALQLDGALTVGVDDTGYDVKFFGATASAYMLWDESADDLKLVGAAGFTVAGDIDIDGTANLDVVDIDGAVDMASTLAVAGVLTGASLDISGDIDVDGTSNLDIVDIDGAVDMATTLAVAGNVDFNGDLDVDGTTNLDVVDIDGAVDMASTLAVAGVLTGASLDISGDIDIDGTANLDIVDVDGAVNFAADVTYADGADIITASAGTSNFRAGVNAGNSIESGGNYNVAVGDEAGTAITTGDNNTAVGYTALQANTTGVVNTAVGADTLTVNLTGSYNTAMGPTALDANTTGSYNTGLGYRALSANISGSYNTALGYNTLELATTVSGLTAIGKMALNANSSGTNNTAVGFESLKTNTTGSQNTAIGYGSLDVNTTGYNNTTLGYGSGGGNTEGHSNAGLGAYTLMANTTGNFNVAVGTAAMQGSTTTLGSVALGYAALNAVTTGDYNVAVGYTAGTLITSGTRNVAVGGFALDACTEGDTNIAIGNSALTSLTTSDNNTAVGLSAGSAITTGDNNLCLGKDSGITGSPGGNITTADNILVIGDENITASNIQVDWTVASDERDKTDFTALDLGLDFVKALAPVTYKWDKRSKYIDKSDPSVDLDTVTHDGTHKEDWLDIGFKAQEVEALEIAAGYKIVDKTNLTTSLTGDGKQYGLQYSKFVPILVKAIQEQQTTIEALTARITTLEG